MATVLAGNLQHVDVLQILKLLISGSKSGRLVLQKEDQRETGELFLNDGRVVHAVCENYLGEPAFHELILWTAGKFAFEPETAPAQRSITKETSQLLSEGTLQYEAWQKIGRHVPSFRIKYRKVENPPATQIKLKSRDWDILHLLENDEYTVEEMASRIGMKDMDVASIVFTLTDVGMIQPAANVQPVAKERVSDGFFRTMENELIQLIGPVASIIIDDVIESYGEDRKQFPKEKAATLVEAISSEIYDPQKQIAFKQTMLKQIKSL